MMEKTEMSEEREAATHDIWDEAKLVAKDQLGEASVSGMPPYFPSMNPHTEGSWQHQEWESAHEHWIMTGLGY